MLSNLILEASNQPSFQHPDTILRSVSQTPTYCEEKINTSKKYRYWRISHPHPLSFAELYFFDSQGKLIQGQSDSIFQAVFDGNPLSNIYQGKESFCVDFSKPVNLSKIICLPRSDGNGIYPDNDMNSSITIWKAGNLSGDKPPRDLKSNTTMSPKERYTGYIIIPRE